MSNLINSQVENFLEDFKNRGEVEFLEEGKEKNDLIESATKRGILIKGSRDLGIIKTIYAFTDKPNANGAILPSKEFQKKLPQIVGKPVNVNHIRDLIVGFYVDYKYILKENKAITYLVFFKSIYEDLWKKAKLFKSRKKLSSSFEIWSPDDKRKYFEDGTYELHQMEMAGGALIFEEHGELPAFKDAKVLEIARKDITSCVTEDCLVCASKYNEEEIIVAEDYFMKEVKKNYRKLQEEKKLQEQKKVEPKKVEPKVEVKKPEVKVEPKVEVKKVELEKKLEVKVEPKPEVKKEEPKPVVNKIKCSHCSEEMDYNGIDVKIKCVKCHAILNKEGVMQHPPQIKDFKMQCPSCKVTNWLILSKTDKEAKLRCESCAKEFRIEFTQEDAQAKKILNKLNLIRKDVVYCYQCGHSINLVGLSNIKDRSIKCPKCSVKFDFDFESKQYKKVSKIEEIKIDKIEKSAKTEKGGKEMDCKLELSKFHRYIDIEKFKDFEKSLPKDYVEINGYIEPDRPEADLIVSARLTTEQRNALPDSDFAVVVRVKDKRTGEMRKIRMFPINDKAHVRNALARLGQPAPQATLKRLGVSIKATEARILRKARQLKMTQLLERYKKASKKKEPKKTVKAEVKKVEPKVEKIEKKAEAKVEPEKKVDKIEAQKHDLELYALENKIAKYATGIRKLASKVRSTNKEIETVKAEKDEKVKFYKENAKKVLKRREELGEDAKELTDEQIVNDKDFEIAKLKKEVDKKNIAKIEIANENVGDKTKDNEFYKQKQKKINAIAYKKTKNTL